MDHYDKPLDIIVHAKVEWWISELLLIAYKKCLFLEIDTITNFLMFKMKYVVKGVVYLNIDTYYSFVVSIREWTYKIMCKWTCTRMNWTDILIA